MKKKKNSQIKEPHLKRIPNKDNYKFGTDPTMEDQIRRPEVKFGRSVVKRSNNKKKKKYQDEDKKSDLKKKNNLRLRSLIAKGFLIKTIYVSV